MQLVKLTVYKRNETILNVDEAFDVDDIVSPIRFNSVTSKSYFDLLPKTPKANIPVSYQVDQALNTIEAMDNKFIRLTVVLRRGQPIVVGGVAAASEVMVFNASKISEGMVTTVIGTRFFYLENYPEQIEYEVIDSIDDIIAQTNSGPGTGTVTSVSADNLSPLFTATAGSQGITPVIHFALVRQDANLVYAGPSGPTAPSGAPSFRSLIGNDIPIGPTASTGGFLVIDDSNALVYRKGSTNYYIPLLVYP